MKRRKIMFNPTKTQLTIIPKLYATEGIPMKDILIYMHFTFPGGSDWYVMEFDGRDKFFGYVILNNDFQISEFGDFYLSELAEINLGGYLHVERDVNWKIKPAGHVERICKARGWSLPEISSELEMKCPYCKKVIVADSTSNEIRCNECKVTR
ncbi:MAG: DUF2958 domain-containing protein [Bacteroidota bacterium]